MVNRNGSSSSSGRGRKKGLLAAVKRHPVRTAGIAAGTLIGLTILCKAACGHDADGSDFSEHTGAARKTAAGGRAARGTSARGGRASARARGGRAQARAESGRTE